MFSEHKTVQAREACALYKKALDEFLPPDYSAVVSRAATQFIREQQADYNTRWRSKIVV